MSDDDGVGGWWWVFDTENSYCVPHGMVSCTFPTKKKRNFSLYDCIVVSRKVSFFTQIYFENEPIKLQKKKKMQCELGCLLLAKI